MKEKVYIFDTTLRDGEQSPGATMNNQEKRRLARQLDDLGVDVIEAGFPASSQGEFEGVREIAALSEHPVIAIGSINKILPIFVPGLLPLVRIWPISIRSTGH